MSENSRVALVAELIEPSEPIGPTDPLLAIPAGVDYLDVRADLAGGPPGDLSGEPDVAALRRHFGGRLVYTLRSTRHGGACAAPPPARHRRLIAAANRYDLIDLEADHDLVPQVLAAVPPHRRRISWHGAMSGQGGASGPGGAQPLRELAGRFTTMAAVPAALYLLAPRVTSAAGALVPLQLLARLRRRDVTAYGHGPLGVWSRLVAPWFGAPTIAGPLRAGGRPAIGSGPRIAGRLGTEGDGVPSVARLCEDYSFPAVPPKGPVCGLIGRVAASSSFPRLHNSAYRRHDEPDLPRLFLPFYLPSVEDFQAGFWPTVPAGLSRLGLPLRGLSVSGPLKEAAMRAADTAGPHAMAVGCANLVVCRGGHWRAEMTDGTAVAQLLADAGVRLDRCRVAVVGCGGAGRAVAVALAAGGADVTVVNRSEQRGRLVADRLGLPFVPLAAFAPAGSAVVVNATPAQDRPPFPLDGLSAGAVIVDMVSPPPETPLVSAARRLGLRAIDGREVTAAEAALHFELMTGHSFGTGGRAVAGGGGPPGAAPDGGRGVQAVPGRKG